MNVTFQGHGDLVDAVIWEHPDKMIQYRLTVSEFRDKQYIGIREWVLDFTEDWVPTYNGVTLPYTLETTGNLFAAIAELLSKAEVLEEVLRYVEDTHVKRITPESE